MPRLSAEDFYELCPGGEIRRWSRAHWGLEDRGLVEFCAPVEPYRDGCPAFGSAPASYLAQMRVNFVVEGFLRRSPDFQLMAPALSGIIQASLQGGPSNGLTVRMRRIPELAGGMASIKVSLISDGSEVARMPIRRPGITTMGTPDPPNLHYLGGLELADWEFATDQDFPGRDDLEYGRQSDRLDVLADCFALDLRIIL
jgi:hypothetical protein